MSARFWMVIPQIATMEDIYDFQGGGPPKIDIVNRSELDAVILKSYYEVEENIAAVFTNYLTGMPAPVLVFRDYEERPDFIPIGVDLTSARMRSAMGLGPSEVQYIDVDASRCRADVQAADYKMMHVVNVASPIDYPRSGGSLRAFELPDGRVVQRWRLQEPRPGGDNPRTVLREDFEPPAPLFHVPGPQWTLATDAFAEKVLRSGVTDMQFMDFTGDRAQTELVLKRL